MLTLLFKLIAKSVDIFLAIIPPLWVFLVQILMIWMVIVLFIPDMSWSDELYKLIVFYIGHPMLNMFNYFYDAFDNVKHMDWSQNNPVDDTYYFMKLLMCIVFALGLPVMFLLGWLIAFFIAVIKMDYVSNRLAVLQVLAGDGSNPVNNTVHMLSGHTTIQDTFDAEVQANAIADALKR